MPRFRNKTETTLLEAVAGGGWAWVAGGEGYLLPSESGGYSLRVRCCFQIRVFRSESGCFGFRIRLVVSESGLVVSKSGLLVSESEFFCFRIRA